MRTTAPFFVQCQRNVDAVSSYLWWGSLLSEEEAHIFDDFMFCSFSLLMFWRDTSSIWIGFCCRALDFFNKIYELCSVKYDLMADLCRPICVCVVICEIVFPYCCWIDIFWNIVWDIFVGIFNIEESGVKCINLVCGRIPWWSQIGQEGWRFIV